MTSIARRHIARLSEAQNHRCAYCGVRFGAEVPELGWTVKDTFATVEHFEPTSLGGGNAWENLVAACHRCNVKRGNGCALAFFAAQGWLSNRQRKYRRRKVERAIREAEPVPLWVLKRRRARRRAYFRAEAFRAKARKGAGA